MENPELETEPRLMTQKKSKQRGRPIGGSSAAIIREYWRIMQQSCRKTKQEKKK